MALGARVLKTGIAVTLSLYVAMLLGFTPPVIAAVAAIFAMQPSIYRSWRYFLDQLQTNLLGAMLALAAGHFFSNEPIAIGIVCILVILICLQMKMEETIGITLVTVVAVMEASGQWDFALNRFLLSLTGIGAAFLVNIFFIPPKPKVQFVSQIHSVFQKMSLLLRTMISDEIKESVFREERQALDGALKSLAGKYSLFEEEQKKLKRAKYSRSRHLVVYKQMLHTMEKGAEVLDVIEEHYFGAGRSPEIDEVFDHHLERLIKYHEHVMLKFDDKLKPDSHEAQTVEEENHRFMDWMMRRGSEGMEGSVRLSVVAAVLYDYGYQTGRLDRLVEQFKGGADLKDPLDFSLGRIRKNFEKS
ncbi:MULTISPECIES: FUSC family protein [Paenibacillus]|uniref:FUSC family protein n=1 Tax=Paenibacillus TaxID=44249 RepID=UPI0022B89C60|nr:aromatic acid exporter family protein [Paenibacillus caseinilyticus]MCZ8521084.1 aromatic acid exporter family protein [Paenibacillus caseinilyticus]